MPPHPLGILPEGHLLLDGGDMRVRNKGLGNLHSLNDALLLEVCGHLDARALASLASASKACYCFCATEDLWKALVLEEFVGRFKWDTARKTWRACYALSKAAATTRVDSNKHSTATSGAVYYSFGVSNKGAADGESKRYEPSDNGQQSQHWLADGAPNEVSEKRGLVENGYRKQQREEDAQQGGGNKRRRNGIKKGAWIESIGDRGLKQGAGFNGGGSGGVQIKGFYSDLLYQPWHCATAELQPGWLEVSNIDRRHNLSPAAFREQYELNNMPVVLVDGATEWPALKKWSMSSLEQAFVGKDIIAGNYAMPFPTYSAYAHNTLDEMPLYLFDKEFLAKAPQLGKDFRVPFVFNEDLFGVLGSSRPDYRWLIVGPARSGSSFHVDPNCTSAWNAVVHGSKKWIMFPPGVVPPGVHPSPDGADVATPVSVMEWFLNFYTAAREAKVPPLECVVGKGEVIFVPRGWWHACLNLETMTIAVTQNYVSSANVHDVLRFIRPGRSDLVSGCALEERANLHGRFLAALKEQRPGIVQMVEEQEEARRARKAQESKLSSLFSSTRTSICNGKTPPEGKAEEDKDEGKPPAKPAATFSFNFSL